LFVSFNEAFQQRCASLGLVAYARSLPLGGVTYNLVNLAQDLINHAKANTSSNAVVIPILQTFTILLEADVLQRLNLHPDGLAACVRHVCITGVHA
jgi:tubulin-specific chaperone D